MKYPNKKKSNILITDTAMLEQPSAIVTIHTIEYPQQLL